MSEQRTILLATDSDAVYDQVDAALGDPTTRVLRVGSGHDVVSAIHEFGPELVVLDLQIGTMGGVAVSLAIRNEIDGRRMDGQNVLLLLDRIADVFIAKHSEADGWIVKPINPLRLRRAAAGVMAGGYFTEHLAEADIAGVPAAAQISSRTVVSQPAVLESKGHSPASDAPTTQALG